MAVNETGCIGKTTCLLQKAGYGKESVITTPL